MPSPPNHPADIGRHWDQHARAYSTAVGTDSNRTNDSEPMLWRYLDELFADRWKTQSVLDLACGGQSSIINGLLQPGAKRVVGVDASFEMSRFTLSSLGQKQIVAQAFAESLPFKDSTFDLITCFMGLHNMPGAEQGNSLATVFSEAHRVVKPGGHLVAVLPKRWSPEERIELEGKAVARTLRMPIAPSHADQIETWAYVRSVAHLVDESATRFSLSASFDHKIFRLLHWQSSSPSIDLTQSRSAQGANDPKPSWVASL